MQVEPMKPRLKEPGIQRLKLTKDDLVPNCATNLKLRRYLLVSFIPFLFSSSKPKAPKKKKEETATAKAGPLGDVTDLDEAKLASLKESHGGWMVGADTRPLVISTWAISSLKPQQKKLTSGQKVDGCARLCLGPGPTGAHTRPLVISI
jgi:hypothetical protein